MIDQHSVGSVAHAQHFLQDLKVLPSQEIVEVAPLFLHVLDNAVVGFGHEYDAVHAAGKLLVDLLSQLPYLPILQ